MVLVDSDLDVVDVIVIPIAVVEVGHRVQLPICPCHVVPGLGKAERECVGLQLAWRLGC